MPTTSRRTRLVAALATLALGSTPLMFAGGADAAQPVDRAPKAAPAAPPGPFKIDLLAINDFHGQLEVVPPSSSSGRVPTAVDPDGSGPLPQPATPAGGAAYLAWHLDALRADARDRGARTLTVAAGDLIGATPLLSAAFHDEPTIETMNAVGLDVTSVGNHEFDEGWRELLRMQNGGCLDDGDGRDNQNSCPDGTFEGADFQYLSANVIRTRTGKTVFPEYVIKRIGRTAKGTPVKMALVGMTLEDTPNIVTAAGVRGLEFIDEVEAVRRVLPELRKKGVKAIVVLLHEGGVPSNNYQYDACPDVAGPGLEIAKSLPPAVDVVVSGHTHQAYNCTVEDPAGQPRLFTSALSIGRVITGISLEIGRRSLDVKRPTMTARNHLVTNGDGTKARRYILNLIDRYKTLVAPIENQVLGQIAPADTKNGVTRTTDTDGESPLGNLIADSMLADGSVIPAGGAEPTIALMNPGGIRADLNENDDNNVTYGAAFSVQPFNNYLVTVTLTGQDLLDVLNEQWNGRNETSRKILQVAGLRYTYDKTLAGQADTDALVPGTVLVDGDGDGTVDDPIVPGDSYRVVVNSFLADGGDGFGTIATGTDRFFGGLDIDALAEFLEVNNPYTAGPTDRITSTPPA